MQVAGQHQVSLLTWMATGARVSNAYPTCPPPGDSPAKAGVMPYALTQRHQRVRKGAIRWRMGMRLIRQ